MNLAMESRTFLWRALNDNPKTLYFHVQVTVSQTGALGRPILHDVNKRDVREQDSEREIHMKMIWEIRFQPGWT